MQLISVNPLSAVVTTTPADTPRLCVESSVNTVKRSSLSSGCSISRTKISSSLVKRSHKHFFLSSLKRSRSADTIIFNV